MVLEIKQVSNLTDS